MRAPAFWWRGPGWETALLAPASFLWGAVAARRMGRGGARAAVPVVCVGNFTVGGAGKTPTALAVAAILRQAGLAPAFLTRGYGGRHAGPVRADPGIHDVEDVGDEALLLARAGPTIVSRDRVAGAALAVSLGADIIVMDDGLQNPSLHKDVSFAVFDGEAGLGNERVLPAGPLRAPADRQWTRVDAALVIGPGERGQAIAAQAGTRGVPVFTAHLVPDPAVAVRLTGRRVLAFAGIGRPGKFYETLRRAGALVTATRAFADHHGYTARELSGLLDEAERGELIPVTTEKDFVRLRRLGAVEPRLASVVAVPVTLVLGEEPDAANWLLSRIAAANV